MTPVEVFDEHLPSLQQVGVASMDWVGPFTSRGFTTRAKQS
jgi:hypothetical protein